MKYLIVIVSVFLISSCGNPCEVLKNNEMIEKYENCDEGMARSICKEMAELQEAEYKCRKK